MYPLVFADDIDSTQLDILLRSRRTVYRS